MVATRHLAVGLHCFCHAQKASRKATHRACVLLVECTLADDFLAALVMVATRHLAVGLHCFCHAQKASRKATVRTTSIMQIVSYCKESSSHLDVLNAVRPATVQNSCIISKYVVYWRGITIQFEPFLPVCLLTRVLLIIHNRWTHTKTCNRAHTDLRWSRTQN